MQCCVLLEPKAEMNVMLRNARALRKYQNGGTRMSEMERLREVVRRLRAEDGCPWDKVQTHVSLKPEVAEEAAEVICGINILEETGKYENLREELGDLLLQVVFHAQIAEEEGLFDLEDVAAEAAEKMLRRHPHVFQPEDPLHKEAPGTPEEVADSWEEIKKREKSGREWEKAWLPAAMLETKELIDVARKRKGFL